MVTTRYSDQQGSKSRQKVMRLYKQWHRPISKRFIKPPYSIREQPRSTRNVVAYPRPVGHTRTTRLFFAFYKLLKRCMKAQLLVQGMVPRALFGGVRIKSQKSVYSSDSQLLLSRPSVSGAYLRSTQRQLLRYHVLFPVRSSCRLFLFLIGISCTVSST